MKYEKPSIMDLGERARRVDGAHIDVCYPGGAAMSDLCTTGSGATLEACIGGSAADGQTGPCTGGATPNASFCTDGAGVKWGGYNTDCFSGTSPDDICNSGSNPKENDPFGCTSGPVIGT